MEPIGNSFKKRRKVNTFTILALLSVLLFYILAVSYTYLVPYLSYAVFQYNLHSTLLPALSLGLFPSFGVISSLISFRRKIYGRLILSSNLIFFTGFLSFGLSPIGFNEDICGVMFVALTCFCAPVLRIIHFIIARLKSSNSNETVQNDVRILKRVMKNSSLSFAPIILSMVTLFVFEAVPEVHLLQVILLTGLVLGLVSLTQNFKDDLFKTIVATTGILMCGFFLSVLFFDVTLPFILNKSEYANKTKTFDGSSVQLNSTVVIPTLDSPIPENTNVIWCSSFQISWNQLKDSVIKQPLQMADAEDICNRLNKAEQSATDLEPGSYYVAAGVVEEGIVNKIKEEMARMFPSEEVPDFPIMTPKDLVAYSFLNLEIKFPNPFEQRDTEFLFIDSTEKKTDVASFGVWDDDSKFDKIRDQVEVICYHRSDPNDRFDERSEFAVDLCKTTEPYQIVLAKIPRQQTLSQSLLYLKSKTSTYRNVEIYDPTLSANDILVVPEMFWRIKHSFNELINREIINPAFELYRLTLANQTILFKLDRYGVVLKSDSRIIMSAGIFYPRYFVFNQPFLIYVKKRDAQNPFFVMWVDNAELLTKR